MRYNNVRPEAETDLNTMTTPGIYGVNGHYVNSPFGEANTTGILFVFTASSAGGNPVAQFITRRDDVYFRGLWVDIWGPWKPLT